ncbi:hypothetical protein QL285_056806 [Trifolium repens]|nr:hypothetical protein QL285_056806 [Trifolium repens]
MVFQQDRTGRIMFKLFDKHHSHFPGTLRSQDEERLRAIYEKQCKRLKALDDRGAEATKIDAAEASIRKLLSKINICIRSVETISGRIHKLRDEELQPQLAALINGY